MLTLTIIQILQVLLNVARWVVLIQFVLSLLIAFNVINMQSNFVRTVAYGFDRLTEPLYRPIRRIMPNLGGLDLSPAVVLLVIGILSGIILPNLASYLLPGAI